MLAHCILSVDYSADWNKTLDHLPAIKPLLGLERLTLVYVVETHKRPHIEGSGASAESRLKALSAQLNKDLGIGVDYEVRRGFAASEVLEAARKLKANGIITLNKSHSSGREFFLGNIAMNLARMTRLPLLMLSSDGAVVEPDAPILFATDGSTANRNAQNCFEAFMKQGGHGLAVWVDSDEHDDAEAAQHVLNDLTGRYPHVAARRLKGTASREIADLSQDERAALVIIGKRGSTPIAELMLGSTAENIARACRQPVLLVPSV